MIIGEYMKKVVIFLLSFITFLLLFILAITFDLKNVVSTSISSMFTSSKINSKIINAIRTNYPELTDYEFLKIQDKLDSSIEMKKITDKYIDNMINDIMNDTISNVDISNEVNNLINEAMSNLNVDNSMKEYIKNKIKNINFDNLYKNILLMVKEENNINKPLKNILYHYNILINQTTKILLSIAVIFNILIIIIINKIESLKSISNILKYTSFLLFILVLIIARFGIPISYSLLGIPLDISINTLLIIGVIYIIISIIFSKIYEYKMKLL